VTRTPATSALGVGLAVLIVSGAELLALRTRGTRVDELPVLVTAGILAGVAAGLAALLARRLPAARATAVVLVPTLAFFLQNVLRSFPGVVPSLFEHPVLAWPAIVIVAFAASLLVAALASRRSGRIVLVAAAAGGVLVSVPRPRPAAPAPVPEADHPDIVLIVMDTTRRDHLSLYGYAKPTSPRLDAFSKGAQVYDQAWSVAPWTPSSHGSMFTGRLPAEHGSDGGVRPPLPRGFPTLAEVLRRAGYTTAGFPANPHLLAPGWKRGFETYQPPWFRGGHTLTILVNRFVLGARHAWAMTRTSKRVFDLSRGWWRKPGGRPRFLFVNLIDPHDPYDPPREERELFLPGVPREEFTRVDHDARTYHLSPGVTAREREILNGLYDAEIAAMDRQIGDFLDWLREAGDLSEALVVIVSDHGERLGERGLVGHHVSMDPILLHVPLVIHYPPELAPARIASRVQTDGLPGYILHLAGIEAPESMAATAFHVFERPFVVAQRQDPDWFLRMLVRRDSTFDISPYKGDWTYVADDRFAYVESTRPSPLSGTLTDLEADPDWERDVAREHPERVAAFEEASARLPGFRKAEPVDLDPEARERLKALGYLD
jgi:arylsulfatase A-like enzyme